MIIVAGTTNVDLFISGMGRMPGVGPDEFTEDNLAFCQEPLRMVLGGNGGNAAFVLGRLEAPVLLCSAIGRDRLGASITEWMDEAGVDVSGLVRSANRATSTTTIVTDADQNRLCFHHRGASAAFGEVSIPSGALARAQALLITSYPLLVGWRPERAAAHLREARDLGVATALDVGPAIGQPAVLAETSELLPLVDYFLCNEHELAVCTGVGDADAGARRVLDAGARVVVLKLGRRGASVYTRRGAPSHVPAFAVDAASTVGAGDAFDAGFLHAVTGGRSLKHAARYANAVAACVVRTARGGLGAPTPDAVQALLEGADDR